MLDDVDKVLEKHGHRFALKHWKRGSTIYRELTPLGCGRTGRRAGGQERTLLVKKQRW